MVDGLDKIMASTKRTGGAKTMTPLTTMAADTIHHKIGAVAKVEPEAMVCCTVSEE